MAPTETTFPGLTRPLSTYRIRTLVSDLEAGQKGVPPTQATVQVEPLAVEPKAPADAKTFFPWKKNPVPAPAEPLKIAFPKIVGESPAAADGFTVSPLPSPAEIKPSGAPLVSPPPPRRQPEPFSSPINKPLFSQKINPKNQTMNPTPPPPNLPTTPTPPALTPRPLTPPPAARPPLPPLSISREPREMPKSAGLPSLEGGSRKSKKMMMLGLSAAAVILIFIVAEIWWFFLRRPATTSSSANQSELLPEPTQTLLPPAESVAPAAAEPSGPVLPEGLLTYDRTQALAFVSETNYQDIAAALASFDASLVAENELVRLAIAIPAPATPMESEVLPAPAETTTSAAVENLASLDDVISGLNLKIPSAISREFSGKYDVFVFGGNSFDRDECEKRKITASACSGARLGLAIEIASPSKIKSALRLWEKTMVGDVKPLVLNKISSASGLFQTGSYNGQTIRYKNLPINTTAVEYALADNILIIGTSKSLTLKVLDNLPATETVETGETGE